MIYEILIKGLPDANNKPKICRFVRYILISALFIIIESFFGFVAVDIFWVSTIAGFIFNFFDFVSDYIFDMSL